MRTAIIVRGVLVAGVLWAAGTYAHEGGTDVRGVVKAVAGNELIVTTTAGAELKVAIVPDTEIVRGKQSVHPGDVHPGERVVVHAVPHGGGLQAKLVKLAEKKS